jgi:hypothetical protein
MAECGERPKEEDVSAFGADCGWSLMGQSANSDAVETALTCHSQVVRHGARCFEFTKTRAPGGVIVLRLRESGRVVEEGDETTVAEPVLYGLDLEQRVSAVSRELDETTRARLEARIVRAIGRAFFRHVASLADAREA